MTVSSPSTIWPCCTSTPTGRPGPSFGSDGSEPGYDAMAFHHPTVLDYHARKAAGHNSFVVLLREAEELSGLETQFGLAMASLAKLGRDDTTPASHRAILARVRNNRGASYLDTGQPQLAAAAFEEARAVAESLVRAHPTVLDHALDLGAIYQNLGHMAGSSGKPQDALEWYTRSVQRLEDSLKTLTPRAAAWRYLAVAYAGRATMLAGLHRDAEMRQDLARMRELDPKPDVEHLRLYRARMLPRPGKPVPPGPAVARHLASGISRARNPLPAGVHLSAGPCDLSPGDAAALIHDLVGIRISTTKNTKVTKNTKTQEGLRFFDTPRRTPPANRPPSSALRAPSPRRGEGDDSPPPTGQASAEPIIGRPRLMGSGMG